MSIDYCEHGIMVRNSHTAEGGERCFECEPKTSAEFEQERYAADNLARTLQEQIDELREEVSTLNARLQLVEQVVDTSKLF